MSRAAVVRITSKRVLSPGGDVDAAKIEEMFRMGFARLAEAENPASGRNPLIRAGETVGIKINTIAGRPLSTRPGVAEALARILTERGTAEDRIVIWDRTNRELRDAGYSLRMNRRGLKVYGTDSQGVGYDDTLVMNGSVGSLLSVIQSRTVDASISLAVLKDHGLAGVTGGMKNYFGAIHNPNKYHDDHCDPYVAEVFDIDLIKNKHRLTVLDALLVQYHRGPAYHARWADPSGALIFSTDGVAADAVGWRWIESLRARAGLPTLAEEDRAPTYIRTAARMGLGTDRPEDINLIEEEL